MPDQLAGTKRERSRRSVQRFYKSVPWGEWWSDFVTATEENGRPRYPTAWSLARAKAKSEWERKLIYEIVGPEPKLALGQKRRAPWLGDWEQRRANSVFDQADSATGRRMRRALEERAASMDRVRRAAALLAIQQVGRWQRAAEQIDSAFAGRPYLPNEAPHSPRNRARSRAYIRMHAQAQQNMWNSLLPFIELSRSEPADERGWLRIIEAFKKK
jgi:hypothetical protein